MELLYILSNQLSYSVNMNGEIREMNGNICFYFECKPTEDLCNARARCYITYG